MEDWLPASVGVNNLVLVESTATRWACNEDGKMTYEKNGKLKRITMRLEAISMLFVGPDEVVGVADKEGDDEGFAF